MKSFKQFTEDPCWKDYKMVGMKDKNGKKVPNCVPVKEDAPANATGSGVDMNPTGGIKKQDKRSKWDISKIFRRANGTSKVESAKQR